MTIKRQKVSVLTLGCSKNLVDSENMIGFLGKMGLQFEMDLNKADHLIVNTCGFIKSSKEESIDVISQAIDLKETGKIKKLIVCGCLSKRYRDQLEEEMPEVDAFLGINDYDGLKKVFAVKNDIDFTGERFTLTPKHYAYLKISDGCNHECSFCAIPYIRGEYISKPIETLIKESEQLITDGVKEINLIAQDTTYYGKDIYGKRMIAELLGELSSLDGVEWVRLLYTYPTSFPHEILDIMAENPKVCNYVDMPLQHISEKLLKSMKRGATPATIKKLIEKIRHRLPELAIRSSFIVGYPGETDRDFRELYDFLSEYKLDRVGVFTYSHEENTSAFMLGDPIDESIKQERRNILMELQQGIALKHNKAFINKIINVMIETGADGHYSGRTQFDAPDVDNNVYVESQRKLKPGQIVSARVIAAEPYDLIAVETK